MKKISLSILILFTVTITHAQSGKPCSAQEASQFDFWIGDWNIFCADTSAGTNSVYKVLDSCSVQENFSDPKNNYNGKSWSVYNSQLKLWQQTWVDNQGEFIYLTGKFENEKMILITLPRKMPDGKERVFKMTYFNITNNSFDWTWESTNDNGTTWNMNWKLHYIRKK